jgi:hypothetical protein
MAVAESAICVVEHDVAPEQTSTADAANTLMRWRRLARDEAPSGAVGSEAS